MHFRRLLSLIVIAASCLVLAAPAAATESAQAARPREATALAPTCPGYGWLSQRICVQMPSGSTGVFGSWQSRPVQLNKWPGSGSTEKTHQSESYVSTVVDPEWGSGFGFVLKSERTWNPTTGPRVSHGVFWRHWDGIDFEESTFVATDSLDGKMHNYMAVPSCANCDTWDLLYDFEPVGKTFKYFGTKTIAGSEIGVRMLDPQYVAVSQITQRLQILPPGNVWRRPKTGEFINSNSKTCNQPKNPVEDRFPTRPNTPPNCFIQSTGGAAGQIYYANVAKPLAAAIEGSVQAPTPRPVRMSDAQAVAAALSALAPSDGPRGKTTTTVERLAGNAYLARHPSDTAARLVRPSTELIVVRGRGVFPGQARPDHTYTTFTAVYDARHRSTAQDVLRRAPREVAQRP